MSDNLSLSDRSTLVNFLRAHNLQPSKKLGQNFLVDEKALRSIIDSAELKRTDHVVEIGAGLGVLTQKLTERAGHVTAVEYDRDIFPVLEKNLENSSNIELYNTDIRQFTPPKSRYKLVANIPYYLTSPILRKFFVETQNRPKCAVLLVQKEVAERICNEQKLSVLALEVRIFGEPEIICHVPRTSFLPSPKVESAVIKIKLYKKPIIPESDIGDLFRLVHAGFRAPRKKIRGSLSAGLPYPKEITDKILNTSKIDQDKRPEDLTIAEWKILLSIIKKLPNPKKGFKRA